MNAPNAVPKDDARVPGGHRNDTSHRPPVMGSIVRGLADPVLMVAGLTEKMSRPMLEALAAELNDHLGWAVPDEQIARLRWRRRGWPTSTATRVAHYARPGDAVAAARRLEAKGYEVEVSLSRRTPWKVTMPARWSTGELADAFRDRGWL